MSARNTPQTFVHDGKTYELRLRSDGWHFTVEAFLDGHRANGYSHTDTLPTAFDLHQTTSCNAIEMLFESAKDDIRQGTWERFLEALKSLNLTEEQSVGCQKCTGRDIEIRQVDGRKMYRCRSCNNLWYEKRTTTGMMEVIF